MDEVSVTCPYCRAGFTALIDWSDAGSSYIHDCEICCQPIRFELHLGPDGDAGEVTVTAEQE